MPATFECLMECVLAGLVEDACMVYLNDVITVVRDCEDNLQKLEQVLSKIRKANLKLTPKKCHLLTNEVNYLGHEINREGIRTDDCRKRKQSKNGLVPKTRRRCERSSVGVRTTDASLRDCPRLPSR